MCKCRLPGVLQASTPLQFAQSLLTRTVTADLPSVLNPSQFALRLGALQVFFVLLYMLLISAAMRMQSQQNLAFGQDRVGLFNTFFFTKLVERGPVGALVLRWTKPARMRRQGVKTLFHAGKWLIPVHTACISPGLLHYVRSPLLMYACSLVIKINCLIPSLKRAGPCIFTGA